MYLQVGVHCIGGATILEIVYYYLSKEFIIHIHIQRIYTYILVCIPCEIPATPPPSLPLSSPPSLSLPSFILPLLPSPDMISCYNVHDGEGDLLSSDQEEGEGDVMESLVVVEFLVLSKKTEDESCELLL